jgi:intein/homing endonuclease
MKTYSLDDVKKESFLMFDCTNKKISELVEGDILMGVDSQPVVIQSISLVEESSNYLVTPVKGDSYIVGASHTLAVNMSGASYIIQEKTRSGLKLKWVTKWFEKTTLTFHSKSFHPSDYENSLEKSESAAHEFLNSKNVIKRFGLSVSDYNKSNGNFIHLTKGYKVELDFPAIPLEIDPYAIGLWIGDGTARDPNITTIDEEIVEYLTNYFGQFGLVVKPTNKKGITFGITTGTNFGGQGRNMFRNYLDNTDLKNNKHIPMEFLKNSKENRLRMLAGLIDTDGSLANNCFDFVQKRERVIDEFLFLCRSLGFSCYKNECQKMCTNSPTKAVGTYFRCCVSGKGIDQVPTLLPRKQAKPREQIKDVLVTGIKLTKIQSFENYRIVTDKPLFLMSDFTVRHSYRPTLKILN